MPGASVSPRIALLGARGIGGVHARILRRLGAEVCAVLGSTRESAEAAAESLARTLGIRARPFFELERLLAMPLDGVSICTPPRLHYAQLVAAFDHGLQAFCEKPLFWEEGATPAEVAARLERLGAHPGRRLFVNTSNAAFIDAARDRLPRAGEVERFAFRMHTLGPYRGRGIAIDLLPHALSLLIRLLGRRELSGFSHEIADTGYRCRFQYGGCAVSFELRQGHGGPKELSFQVNGHELRREQEGEGETYRVRLVDARGGAAIGLDDPFTTYIGAFLESCRKRSVAAADQFDEAAQNLSLMAQALAHAS